MLGDHDEELDEALIGREQYPDSLGVIFAESRARAALGQINLGLSDKTVIEMLPKVLRPNTFTDVSGGKVDKQDVDKPDKDDSEGGLQAKPDKTDRK